MDEAGLTASQQLTITWQTRGDCARVDTITFGILQPPSGGSPAIIDGRRPHSILLELFAEGAGTLIRAGA